MQCLKLHLILLLCLTFQFYPSVNVKKVKISILNNEE